VVQDRYPRQKEEDIMPGSLNDILAEPISEENERVLLEHLMRKMRTSAELAVSLLHAMEDRFGPEAREVVRDMAKSQEATPRPGAGEPEADLRELCAAIEGMTAGSHLWERVIDEPDRIGYHFTRCMNAEIYRELGEPELGLVICASDEPWFRSYNPKLAFKRTKTLMAGDEVCDHLFYVEK
jgi:hypothetical protein